MRIDSETVGLKTLCDSANETLERELGCPAAVFGCAPGRVNLIGEHTDYNEGYVFPVAIDHYVVVAMNPSHDAESAAVSALQCERAIFSVSRKQEMKGWTRFPSGVGWTLTDAGQSVRETISAVESDLPMGSGLSSSAALELAYLCAYRDLYSLELTPLELVRLAQSCEHKYIGVKCGIMDQMACALGRAGHAMLIDTRDLNLTYVAIPPDLTIVVCDTGTPRTLAASGYNERRAECEEACRQLEVASLRDATLNDVDRLPEKLSKRAKHVVTENERCLAFAGALATNNNKAIFDLMKSSHLSLRDDYEVSCPELDAMAEVAWSAPGCSGARLTGAGFGGACIALVEDSAVDRFVEHVLKEYRKHVPGSSPRLIACNSCDGARII